MASRQCGRRSTLDVSWSSLIDISSSKRRCAQANSRECCHTVLVVFILPSLHAGQPSRWAFPLYFLFVQCFMCLCARGCLCLCMRFVPVCKLMDICVYSSFISFVDLFHRRFLVSHQCTRPALVTRLLCSSSISSVCLCTRFARFLLFLFGTRMYVCMASWKWKSINIYQYLIGATSDCMFDEKQMVMLRIFLIDKDCLVREKTSASPGKLRKQFSFDIIEQCTETEKSKLDLLVRMSSWKDRTSARHGRRLSSV